MSVYTLRYAGESHSSDRTFTSYSLVELPPAIASSSSSTKLNTLVIKGQPEDDAVLCTSDTTYNIRAVQNSNSLLISRPSYASDRKGKKRADGDHAPGSIEVDSNINRRANVDIQTTLHQTLELETTVPKLDRIRELLRSSEWTLDDVESVGDDGPRQKKRRTHRHTREDILDLVPASDAQIEAALSEMRVVELEGFCRILSSTTIASLLQNILNTLAMLGYTAAQPFPLDEIAASLSQDDSIPSEITLKLATWFGTVEGAQDSRQCTLDIAKVAAEIGKERLARHGHKPINLEGFLSEWRGAVGEEHSQHCDLALLAGTYLLNPSKKIGGGDAILYFPISSLPSDPASRFNELFSVKARWRVDEIAPFLQGLAADPKKRDALTLKFTRKVKGDDGQMYYVARGR